MIKKRYKYLVNQDPMMCVPACIMMILKRRNLDKGYSQIGLASFLGFQNDEDSKEVYPDYPVADSFENQGCHVTNLNKQLFKPMNIPLQEEYIALGTVRHIMEYNDTFLFDLIHGKDADVIVNLDYSIINTDHKPSRHVVLVESVDLDDICLVLAPIGDPYANITERKTVNIYKLLEAIKKVDGGFWVITARE